jgi:protease-4
VPPPPYVSPTAPAPAPRPRKSRGWMIFAIILLLLLGFSVLLNIGHFISGVMRMDGMQSRHQVGPRLDEVVVEDNDASDKIAVITVDGVITGQMIDRSGFNMVDVIKAQLKRADKDSRVKAVILKVDSPGGEVLASDDISEAIKKFQQDSSKPVVVSMGSLAASGGYYISAPCRYIVANEMTITGSIGVIMSTYNVRGLMNKVGVQPVTFKSGKYKDMLSFSREPETVTEEEKAMLQRLIDETYGKFKSVVADGRKQAHDKVKQNSRALVPNWTEYADGRVFSGKEAKDLGFVDDLGDFEHAVDRTKEIAGIKHANIVEYRQRVDLADLLGILGKSESRGIKVDLGLELPKLQAGRLYFLSPTYLN